MIAKKLSTDQVLGARLAFGAGARVPDLARSLKVSPSTVYRATRGQSAYRRIRGAVPPKAWPGDVVLGEKARAMLAKGRTMETIGARLGIAQCRLRRILGDVPRPRQGRDRAFTNTEALAVTELFAVDRTMTLKAIAKRYGCAEKSVQQVLWRWGSYADLPGKRAPVGARAGYRTIENEVRWMAIAGKSKDAIMKALGIGYYRLKEILKERN